MFSKIFPLLDYLYIYQILEYEPEDFLKWYFKNPFKRNMQRKHKLEFTQKAQMLAVTSSFIMLCLALLFSLMFFGGLLISIVLIYIVLEALSPFFILLSNLLILPFEVYRKNKIINQAKIKISRLHNLKTVAIVGSFAKTSTKNMLYTLLWKKFNVVKTPKSFNTDIAISRTILRDLKETTDIFIVEMDAYHKGDIKRLAEIAKPDMAVITAIAPQHLERFGSMEKLVKTQFEIAEALPSPHHEHENLDSRVRGNEEEGLPRYARNDNEGQLFLNASDNWTRDFEENYKREKVFFGENSGDFKVSELKQTKEGIGFDLTSGKESVKINLPIFGTHNAVNFAAAAAIANKLGLTLQEIQARAALILPTEHRLEVRKLNNLTVIDNTYNTNTKVIKSSLKLLSDLDGDKKILITPGLVELGDKAFEENVKFASLSAKVADEVIIVGENAKAALLKGFEEAGFMKDKIHLVKSTKDGLNLLSKLSKGKTVVLLENDLPDQYS